MDMGGLILYFFNACVKGMKLLCGMGLSLLTGSIISISSFNRTEPVKVLFFSLISSRKNSWPLLHLFPHTFIWAVSKVPCTKQPFGHRIQVTAVIAWPSSSIESISSTSSESLQQSAKESFV